MAEQPIHFVRGPQRATRPADHTPAVPAGAQPLNFAAAAPAAPSTGQEALQAERLQSKVRARLSELAPALADATIWEGYDEETGRADAVITIDRPSNGFESVDLWLLSGPAQIWLLTVGYLDDSDTAPFRELARDRFDDPLLAAEAFARAWRARTAE